jgi:integrase
LPRELSAEEIFSLLRAAEPLTRRAILLIVSGLAPEEALALRWRDVDREHGVVRVDGAHARSVRLSAVATRSLSAASELPDAPLLGNAADEPATEDTLCTGLLNAAHDAGLERVHEITPQALRHSYIAFLVRQGIRFADLAKLVGQLPSAALAAYSGLAPSGARAALGSVKLVYPSLERLDTM